MATTLTHQNDVENKVLKKKKKILMEKTITKTCVNKPVTTTKTRRRREQQNLERLQSKRGNKPVVLLENCVQYICLIHDTTQVTI